MRGKSIFFLFVVGFFLFFLVNSVSALGISPAFREYNFEPGLHQRIDYTIFASEGMEIGIDVTGDLAEYFKLDKTDITGSGVFSVEFELPEIVEKPGMHRMRVYVAQKIDPEVASGFIGTRIVTISTIDIYVPYPGRYLETQLSANDVNAGEPVTFFLNISSQGKEDVTIQPLIEIYSDSGKSIDNLYFTQREIKSQESINLKKTFNTTGLNPGKYKAMSTVDYGNLAESEADFRIGNLSIEMTGYTNKFYIGKLQKFEIGVESGWNNLIDGVYAEVEVFNETGKITDFKTSTTSLTPWEAKNITGYLDTIEMLPGMYDANITLRYFGKDRGISQSKTVKIELIEQPTNFLWFVANNWYIFTGVGVLVLIIIGFIILFRKIDRLKNSGGRNAKKKKR